MRSVLHCIAELPCGDFEKLDKELLMTFLRLLATCTYLGQWQASLFLLDRTALVVSSHWTGLQLLICVLCLLVDWAENNGDWNHPKELLK